ncbi:putative GPI-anchored wall transfer protein [Paratrimastix pyriformis]|uniref:GPI-anchored wall transfer protein n=1 Tax=Paratrimastix pyriformis TaxID=342808 RepID=A0ABQ8UJW0_9EUKA|nr:putative GPI-anchored wall transfer protein [Paratrimastix pyriformis]
MDPAVRAIKEARVTGHSGTTVFEAISIFISAHVFLFLSQSFLGLMFPSPRPTFGGKLGAFLVEFALLVFPMVIICTFWDALGIVVLVVPALLALVLFYANVRRSKRTWRDLVAQAGEILSTTAGRPLGVTYERAVLMVLTLVTILAVDFPAFPTRFAKAEQYGVSPMDVGNGGFVFISGLCFVRGPRGPSARPTSTARRGLWARLAASAPAKAALLAAMGIVRWAATTAVGYQEHASEYGLHWNFFVTLGAVTVLSCLLLGRLSHPAALGLALGALAGYQWYLTSGGLAEFILHAPRTGSLFAADREGILNLIGLSLPHIARLAQSVERCSNKATVAGYTALHVVGSWVGSLIRRVPAVPRSRLRLGAALALQGAGMAAGVSAACLGHQAGLLPQAVVPSRRLGNLGYVALTGGVMTCCVGLSLLVEVALAVTQATLRHKKQDAVEKTTFSEQVNRRSPIIATASQHGLAVFLVPESCRPWGKPRVVLASPRVALFGHFVDKGKLRGIRKGAQNRRKLGLFRVPSSPRKNRVLARFHGSPSVDPGEGGILMEMWSAIHSQATRKKESNIITQNRKEFREAFEQLGLPDPGEEDAPLVVSLQQYCYAFAKAIKLEGYSASRLLEAVNSPPVEQAPPGVVARPTTRKGGAFTAEVINGIRNMRRRTTTINPANYRQVVEDAVRLRFMIDDTVELPPLPSATTVRRIDEEVTAIISKKENELGKLNIATLTFDHGSWARRTAGTSAPSLQVEARPLLEAWAAEEGAAVPAPVGGGTVEDADTGAEDEPAAEPVPEPEPDLEPEADEPDLVEELQLADEPEADEPGEAGAVPHCTILDDDNDEDEGPAGDVMPAQPLLANDDMFRRYGGPMALLLRFQFVSNEQAAPSTDIIQAAIPPDVHLSFGVSDGCPTNMGRKGGIWELLRRRTKQFIYVRCCYSHCVDGVFRHIMGADPQTISMRKAAAGLTQVLAERVSNIFRRSKLLAARLRHSTKRMPPNAPESRFHFFYDVIEYLLTKTDGTEIALEGNRWEVSGDVTVALHHSFTHTIVIHTVCSQTVKEIILAYTTGTTEGAQWLRQQFADPLVERLLWLYLELGRSLRSEILWSLKEKRGQAHLLPGRVLDQLHRFQVMKADLWRHFPLTREYGRRRHLPERETADLITSRIETAEEYYRLRVGSALELPFIIPGLADLKHCREIAGMILEKIDDWPASCAECLQYDRATMDRCRRMWADHPVHALLRLNRFRTAVVEMAQGSKLCEFPDLEKVVEWLFMAVPVSSVWIERVVQAGKKLDPRQLRKGNPDTLLKIWKCPIEVPPLLVHQLPGPPRLLLPGQTPLPHPLPSFMCPPTVQYGAAPRQYVAQPMPPMQYVAAPMQYVAQPIPYGAQPMPPMQYGAAPMQYGAQPVPHGIVAARMAPWLSAGR